LAGLFWDSSVVSKYINLEWVSSVAASSSLAINNNLRRKGHIGPSVVSENVDSISKRAGWAMSPA